MNQKGFAITGILYTLLLIAVVSMNLLLYNLLNRKTILDQIKTDTVNAIEKDSDFDYIMKEINELKLNKADRIEVQEVNKIATNTQTLASNAATKYELQTLNNTVNTKVTISEALDKAYPVGSIYMTLTNVNPGTLFGGTWQILPDRFLVGANNHYAINSTGGEATHTLTVAEMPNHGHDIYYGINGAGSNVNNVVALSSQSIASGTFSSNHIGGGQPHNNLPPYLAVYMWKRIS